MPRYVITPDVAIHLAGQLIDEGRPLRAGVALVAPTLLRSQVLSILFRHARAGELDRVRANALLDAMRGWRIRLLGDRVLQSTAWAVATDLGWEDTLDAEYVALTRLQADFLVTLDPALRAAAARLVPVADAGDLTT